MIFGFILIGIGTVGILALNFWPKKRQTEAGVDEPTDNA
jgi:hypothetical protein